MAELQDLGLEKQSEGFALVAPMTDLEDRMKNRFLIQFLSSRRGERGSVFISEMAAGRIKSNAEIISLFSLASQQVMVLLRKLNNEIFPLHTNLDSFTFIDLFNVILNFTIFTTEGSISANAEVSES